MTMSERERRDAGLWYDANYNKALCAERLVVMDLAGTFNATPYAEAAHRQELLDQLIAEAGRDVEVLSPFMVDYGYNVHIGERTFINHGAYLMDGAPITIGAHCFIGPDFGAYTASHPLLAEERNQGLERALPISVGDNCWIGARVCVLGGVSIGSDCVIGAGSVVTHDIPAGYVAMGTPCKPVRTITDADRIDRNGNERDLCQVLSARSRFLVSEPN